VVFEVLMLSITMFGVRMDLAAAAPVHPFLEAASLDGSTSPDGEFERACGVAVDGNGDVYVANSDKGAIDVYRPTGNYLTRIADAEGPCGLAVDSAGNVYAVNSATGNVVMFAPLGGVYPPTAGLGYGAAQTIDPSGEANTVAVDPANDRLFVNQGIQIVERQSAAGGSAVLQGEIGKGTLVQGFGVDVYGANGNVYASDEAGKVYVFDPTGTKIRAEIDGAGSPAGVFGSLPEANIAVDQANGHVFVSDIRESGGVYEFEGSGPYLSEISHGFADAGPSAIAVDPTTGATHGRVYVTSGSGPGSRVDAFEPLPPPAHPPRPALSPLGPDGQPKQFNQPCGIAVDSFGDLYVTDSGTSSIDIFKPQGNSLRYLKTIVDTNRPCGVAVDAAGNVFAAHPNANRAVDQTVLEYPREGSFPPGESTTYGAAQVIYQSSGGLGTGASAVAVNPTNQRIFVARSEVINEYASAAAGAGLLRDNLGEGLGLGEISSIGVYGRSGNVYATSNLLATKGVVVFDPVANERLAKIDGTNAISKSPGGSIGGLSSIAVDQSNGHVFVNPFGDATDTYEFEASGAYVSRFGRSADNGTQAGIAVDNSGLANDRDIFMATGVGGIGSTVDAYGPVSYGEPPLVTTGGISGAGGANATLEGTVDPRDFAVESCRFEYVDDASFEASEFTGAASATCAETPAEIGSGSGPVHVHADISVSNTVRYHYRLTATNKYGAGFGDPRLFGPVVVVPRAAFPVLYTEATLRASIDPAGQPTSYHFDYGEDETYGHSTPVATISGGDSPVEVEGNNLFGLAPQTTYHFRVVASNGVSSFEGPDQTLTTAVRPAPEDCPNSSVRSGASASLPDCRAYEEVTPALNGMKPESLNGTTDSAGDFDTWLGAPSGGSVIFDTGGSVPGVDGNGVTDQYQSLRSASGWSTRLVAPSGAESENPRPHGISADHGYAFWSTLDEGHGGSLEAAAEGVTRPTLFLRTPDGRFELVGQGSLGRYPYAMGRWIGDGGSHVIFSTGGTGGPAVPLEPDAPAAGIDAVYDRTSDGVTHVVSLLPGDVTPTTDAEFAGVSADGSGVIFRVEGKLYERRDDTNTVEVAPAGSTFAGISRNGNRVFYVRPGDPSEFWIGNVFAFDSDLSETTQLTTAGGATVINVSADGSHVYFVSPQQLDGVKGSAGARNLYVWDGASVRFIAILSPEDVRDPRLSGTTSLAAWTNAIGSEPGGFTGPGAVPARSTPDGAVFVFQSFSNLTSFDAKGHSEIYRYDTNDHSLGCVSCMPNGNPPSGEAELQQLGQGLKPGQNNVGRGVVNAISHIPNVTEDGSAVFFQTVDSLLPADGDGYTDVYEWKAGRLSLISSGNSRNNDYLYGMSADGRDLYFETNDSLVPQDRDGGDPSIYDARVGGGFAQPSSQACLEDACQGIASTAPSLPAPASTAVQGGERPRPPRCKKHFVRKHGKCVKKHRKRHHQRSKHHRGGKK
jgi:sugar lactone lactonase YvrE